MNRIGVVKLSPENIARPKISTICSCSFFVFFFLNVALLTKKNCHRNWSKANVSEVLRKYLLFASLTSFRKPFRSYSESLVTVFPPKLGMRCLWSVWPGCHRPTARTMKTQRGLCKWQYQRIYTCCKSSLYSRPLKRRGWRPTYPPTQRVTRAWSTISDKSLGVPRKANTLSVLIFISC